MTEQRIKGSLRTRSKVWPAPSEVQSGLDAAQAFARLTNSSVYIIDYTDHFFEYVSDAPLFLCGHTPQEVMAMGYDFYARCVPPEDLELLTIVNEAGFDFFERLPPNQRHRHFITYDFHLLQPSGKTWLVHHKLTPLCLTAAGKLHKALCTVSPSPHKKAGQVTIWEDGSKSCWHLDVATRTWQASHPPKLSESELEMLRLYARGFTIAEIAGKMFVSPDTVKYYRRRVFEHFGVGSMIEALHRAIQAKII